MTNGVCLGIYQRAEWKLFSDLKLIIPFNTFSYNRLNLEPFHLCKILLSQTFNFR